MKSKMSEASKEGISDNNNKIKEGLKILIIDDNEDAVSLLMKFLENISNQIFSVTNGDDAIQLFKEHRYGVFTWKDRKPKSARRN